jgi:hypothetical protein
MKNRNLFLALLMVVSFAVTLFVLADDDITISMSWTYDVGGRKRSLPSTTTKFSVGTNNVIENIQNIGTSEEALTMGEVTNPGFAYFKNLDTTNFIEIGQYDVNTNFVAFVKIETNAACVLWLGTTAPYAKADTAACKLDYVIADR